MKKIILLFIVLSMSDKADAQSTLSGEYYLRGVTEIASGFLLKPDSTFEFFFPMVHWIGEAQANGR